MWLEVPQIQVILYRVLLLLLLFVPVLQQQCDMLQAYMEETQRHDFCVSKELSIALAQKTAAILQEIRN